MGAFRSKRRGPQTPSLDKSRQPVFFFSVHKVGDLENEGKDSYRFFGCHLVEKLTRYILMLFALMPKVEKKVHAKPDGKAEGGNG